MDGAWCVNNVDRVFVGPELILSPLPLLCSRGRAAKLARLAGYAKERAALQQEYETLKDLDPQVLADLEKELDLVTQAAHRWTDNIFNCQTYLVKKRGMEKKQAVCIYGLKVVIVFCVVCHGYLMLFVLCAPTLFEQYRLLGITDNFDYPEDKEAK